MKNMCANVAILQPGGSRVLTISGFLPYLRNDEKLPLPQKCVQYCKPIFPIPNTLKTKIVDTRTLRKKPFFKRFFNHKQATDFLSQKKEYAKNILKLWS